MMPCRTGTYQVERLAPFTDDLSGHVTRQAALFWGVSVEHDLATEIAKERPIISTIGRTTTDDDDDDDDNNDQ